MLDDPEIVFARLAVARGVLDEDQIEMLFGLKALDRMCGRRRRGIADLSVSEGLLPADKAASLGREVRYCLVRQADRLYGRIAVQRGLLPKPLVDGLLEDQRRAFRERGILQRLSRILLVAGAVTPEQDGSIKREVLGREPLPAAAS